ncbi:unnamed protein product [Peniophora sp. CBMAI 1063]|nr:unnamed protein product [Peniophora sp. CBMAI 1063]
MDVPFASSGALSAGHYALVRKVELSQTLEEADEHLRSEIRAIQRRLTRPTTTVYEYLVVLLYCHDALNSVLDPGELDFALPPALTLAEAGKTIRAQRLGYLFCATFLSPEHELHLLLVNTLRKHLESDSLGHISLALDHLIQAPSHDLLIASQTRLRQLLSHSSPIIRRKALYAIKALGRVDASILQHLAIPASKRVRDADAAVSGAAVAVCEDLDQRRLLDDQQKTHIYKSLVHFLKASPTPAVDLVVQKFLRFYTSTGAPLQVLEAVRPVLRSGIPRSRATILECYKVVQASKTNDLLQVFMPQALVQPVQPYLSSGDANEQAFFLACLSCVDPDVWAGTVPERPLLLDALEVERVVQLMASPDPLIRIQTARILCRVDNEIVRTRFDQLLESNTSSPTVDAIAMLIELALVLAVGDGAGFGSLLYQALNTLSQSLLGPVIELVLSTLRSEDEDFARDAATAVLAAFTTNEQAVNPTFVVIIASLVAEYGESVSVSPSSLLDSLSGSLHQYTASIQEVILLAMVRAASQCDGPVSTATERVKKLQDTSGQHIRRRCQQYLRLSEDQELLRAVVGRTQSRSLPDLSASIEAWYASPDSLVASTSRLNIDTDGMNDSILTEKGESTPKRPSITSGQHGASTSSLISIESPFLSDPGSAQSHSGTFDRAAFTQTWQNPTAWTARGWYAEPGSEIVKKLRTLGGTLGVESTASNDTDLILGEVAGAAGTLAMKITDKDDIGGSLWQLKSDGQALQMEVKRLLET